MDRLRRLEWWMLGPWLFAGGLVAVAYVAGWPTCPARQVVGWPCPGCGMTRAAVDLVILDFAAALHHHPLVFLVAPLIGWLMVATVAGEDRVRLPPAWLWLVTGVALVALWALRMAGYLGGHPDLL